MEPRETINQQQYDFPNHFYTGRYDDDTRTYEEDDRLYSPPRLKYRHTTEPFDAQEIGILAPKRVQMTTTEGTGLHGRGYTLPQLRRPSVNLDRLPVSHRPTQEGKTHPYPSYFDDEPYNPNPDPLASENINALLLEWTPAVTTETAEAAEEAGNSRKHGDRPGNVRFDEGQLAVDGSQKQEEESTEERSRGPRDTKLNLNRPESENRASRIESPLNYGSDTEPNMDPQGGRKTPDHADDSRKRPRPRRQPTVEAVSDEAFQRNYGPRDSPTIKEDESHALQDKGRQPEQPIAPRSTEEESSPDWARRLVEATETEPATQSMRHEGPVVHGAGGPLPRSHRWFNGPGVARPHSRRQSTAWSLDEQADRGLNDSKLPENGQEYRLQQASHTWHQ